MPFVPSGGGYGAGGPATRAYNYRPPTQGTPFQPYRGGGAGVQADLGLRDQFAGAAASYYANRDQANNQYGQQWNLNNQNFNNQWALGNQQAMQQAQMAGANAHNGIVGSAAGMVTNGQIAAAKGDIQPARDMMYGLSQNGQYTKDEYNRIQQDRYNSAQQTKLAMQQTLNSQSRSMGLGLNAGMMQSIGMQGDFAAAGQRGEALAGLDREQAQSRVLGMQGYGDLSKVMAGLDSTATQENALAMLGHLQTPNFQNTPAPNFGPMPSLPNNGGNWDPMASYEQFRNAKIGPGDYNWNQPPPISPFGTNPAPGGSPWNPNRPITRNPGYKLQ